MSYDFTGATVSSTYGRLVQVVHGTPDLYYDGFGNLLNLGPGTSSIGPQGPTGPSGTSMIFQGEWDSMMMYFYYDFVTYNGDAYLCISNLSGTSPWTSPDLDTTHWERMLIGLSGTSGTSGLNGTSGENGTSGTSGTSGENGTSGTSGTSGENGTSGTSGSSGENGTSGTSGINGLDGTSGNSGTSGINGISSGQLYYFNQSIVENPSIYRELSIEPISSSQQIITTLLNGGLNNILISQFITSKLGFGVIPGGTQRFHLHFLKPASNDQIETYVQIDLANEQGVSYGNLTANTNTSLIGWVNPITPVEVTVDLVLPTITINPTDRMIVKIYSNNRDSTNHVLKWYTEGTSYYSFVLTSVGLRGTTSGVSGTSGLSGTSGTSGINGLDGTSGENGTSGTSGINGLDGTSGTSGINGLDGTSGENGTSGTSGINGLDGTSGENGTSGTSGINGLDGTSGTSGINGLDGTSGTSGINGLDGTSGTSGINGLDGTSGTSGTSGINGLDGTSGTSGINGLDGTSGTSGINGLDGTSGTSGINGLDGTSGTSGINGLDGTSGTSGINGLDGTSGTSGISGLLSLTGSTNNGLITLDGSSPNATVESNLTFDGSTLLVSGTVSTDKLKVNTGYSNGYILTSDSVGNASWQNYGNAKEENYYFSISNSADTRPIYSDSNVTFNWDETANQLEMVMNIAPSGSGDMRSLAYILGGVTQNTFIVSTGVIYDLYASGVSAGNRLEVFVSAENDVNYPAYHITVYNTGESFQNIVWIKKIYKI